MSESPIIMVFQMGRVASLSWYEAIKTAAPSARVFHLHFISSQSRDFIRLLLGETGPAQTIRRPRLLRNLEVLPAGLNERWVEERWIGGPLRIISGMRDPVSRGASLLMYMADVFGHRNDRLAFREGGKIDALVSHWLRGWSDELGYTQPEDTFARLRSFLLAQYRSWFANELNNGLGIDIFSARRVSDRRTWRIVRDNIEVLFYRYEDLPSRELVDEVGEFLALDIDLPMKNQTGSRRSGDLYAELQEHCHLPEEWLERIYAEPILGHFYSTEEIIAFKARSLPRA